MWYRWGEPPGRLRLAQLPDCAAECHSVSRGRLSGRDPAPHADSGGIYGSPEVTAELGRRGRYVNLKRVERLMRLWGIVGVHKRRRRRSRFGGDTHTAPANLVRRDFAPRDPDLVWAGDITFIPTGQGWLHLAVVLDLGSRRLIGFAVVTEHARPPCRRRAARCANRRAGWGNCWDNSVVESFFSTLKRELVQRRRFVTRDQARREIFAWMGRYNNQRVHSTLDYTTPTEWEERHRTAHQLEQAA